ncbi:MAG: fructose-6-phosphate aldolase [Bacteroidetes bacterium]|nr:MAG: fructose-6-phosphate aldolase [Bacteroidota bacterium]
MQTYYLMKVKGKAKIPDYIQLRDEHLTLIGYFRPGRNERLSRIVPDEQHAAHLMEVIEAMDEYGKIRRVDLS